MPCSAPPFRCHQHLLRESPLSVRVTKTRFLPSLLHHARESRRARARDRDRRLLLITAPTVVVVPEEWPLPRVRGDNVAGFALSLLSPAVERHPFHLWLWQASFPSQEWPEAESSAQGSTCSCSAPRCSHLLSSWSARGVTRVNILHHHHHQHRHRSHESARSADPPCVNVGRDPKRLPPTACESGRRVRIRVVGRTAVAPLAELRSPLSPSLS
jgi:hypothetical protein